MQPKFRSEQIYDAALDDDCFANLPSLLNQAYGARSCTLHWRHDRYDAEVMAHSGYFSDAQLQDYTENFTGSDLWSLAGLHPDRANQVWNCDELVPVATYEKTAFYNDWIRAMGDDTYHCIGIAMQTQWGFGFIGLHRGRTQGSFSEDHVRALKDDVSHLGRMLMMRGRLTSADRMAVQRKAMVDVVGHAMMLGPTLATSSIRTPRPKACLADATACSCNEGCFAPARPLLNPGSTRRSGGRPPAPVAKRAE